MEKLLETYGMDKRNYYRSATIKATGELAGIVDYSAERDEYLIRIAFADKIHGWMPAKYLDRFVF